jgi:hypothetical protein
LKEGSVLSMSEVRDSEINVNENIFYNISSNYEGGVIYGTKLINSVLKIEKNAI